MPDRKVIQMREHRSKLELQEHAAGIDARLAALEGLVDELLDLARPAATAPNKRAR